MVITRWDVVHGHSKIIAPKKKENNKPVTEGPAFLKGVWQLIGRLACWCITVNDDDNSGRAKYARKWWKSFQTIRLINCPEQSGEENISEYFVFKITGQLEEATPYYDRKVSFSFHCSLKIHPPRLLIIAVLRNAGLTYVTCRLEGPDFEITVYVNEPLTISHHAFNNNSETFLTNKSRSHNANTIEVKRNVRPVEENPSLCLITLKFEQMDELLEVPNDVIVYPILIHMRLYMDLIGQPSRIPLVTLCLRTAATFDPRFKFPFDCHVRVHFFLMVYTDYTEYGSAIDILRGLYVRPKNVMYARNLPRTCRQENGQNIDQFERKLKSVAKNCRSRDCDWRCDNTESTIEVVGAGPARTRSTSKSGQPNTNHLTDGNSADLQAKSGKRYTYTSYCIRKRLDDLLVVINIFSGISLTQTIYNSF
ncbi:hypothetical protein CLF_108959 [Clonorchis sinensis]|uniref:Uncharacterized protein n=1 Tax=Clonorchis sinensis TaxID=79923 RepID=G7YS45_CLOSI|nr:hypothetical protein CLF_108959 [Clonorchis sinensis]